MTPEEYDDLIAARTRPTPQAETTADINVPTTRRGLLREIGRLAGQRDEARQQLNTVYRERAHLVALLATLFPSHIGYTDPSAPEWAVVIIETPAGQLSWHVARDDMELFAHVPVSLSTDRGWDGHTTDGKYERIRQLTADKASEPPLSWPDHDRTEWGVRFSDPDSGVSAVGNYGPAEAFARRMAAQNPAHSTILHRRVIRRQDRFGPWIEEAPETSALPTPWVGPSASPGQ